MPAGAFSAAKIAPQGFSAAKIVFFAKKSAKTRARRESNPVPPDSEVRGPSH